MDARSRTILTIGVIALIVGFGMPGEITRTTEECVEPTIGGNCAVGGFEQVTREVDNGFKEPTMVVGGVLTLLGGVLAMGDEA